MALTISTSVGAAQAEDRAFFVRTKSFLGKSHAAPSERLSLDADDDEPAGAFATFHTTGKGGGYEDQDIEQLANALQAFAALQDEDP
jgi:hypothetical protein